MGKKTPLPRLEHIEDAAANIERAVGGKSHGEVFADGVLRAAVERWIEIISEASRRIPDDMKASHPEIPWRDIAGIGNVLRHDYDGVLPDLMWAIVKRDLAPLKSAIAAMKADWLTKNPTPPS